LYGTRTGTGEIAELINNTKEELKVGGHAEAASKIVQLSKIDHNVQCNFF
jgi:hypothetical protein